MRVTVTCATCGTIYASTDIKAPIHHDNARAKAERVAKDHSSRNPEHTVVLDPGEPLAAPIEKKPFDWDAFYRRNE